MGEKRWRLRVEERGVGETARREYVRADKRRSGRRGEVDRE